MKKYFKFLPFILTIILRIPDFFQPYWYTDTGIYSAIGESINHGAILYKTIIDNKPLIIYYLYALLEKLPLSLMFSVQFISLLCALITEYLIYKICEIRFNKDIGLISMFVLTILLGTDFIHSNGANVETIFILFSTLSIYIFFLKENIYKYIYLAGIILGIGFLIKVPVIFDGIFLIFYMLFTYKFLDFFKKSFIYGLGIITPVVLFLLYEISIGNIGNTIKYTFTSNFSYVAIFNHFYGISYTYINLLVYLLILLLAYFLYKKGKINTDYIFFTLWLSSDLFVILLTGRPYIHYIIQILPAVSIFFAYIIYNFRNWNLKKSLIISLSTIFVVFLLGEYFFRNELSWQVYDNFSNTFPFYSNFIEYSLGSITRTQYFDTFPYNTNVVHEKRIYTANINYKMASLLDTLNVKDKDIFIAANFPWVYYMTGSYTTHFYTADFIYGSSNNDKRELLLSLEKNRPYVILFYNDGYTIKGFDSFLKKNYSLYKYEYGAKLYKLKG